MVRRPKVVDVHEARAKKKAHLLAVSRAGFQGVLSTLRRLLSRSARATQAPLFALHEKKDAQLNVYNVKAMLAQEPHWFEFLRFDPNNDCNVHCVYCHNHRSKDTVATQDFRGFLERNVIAVDNFQLGCIMEPTLDPRLGDLMLMVAGSRAKPTGTFLLQTNGILLHKHDQAKMRDSRLSHVSVSIDAADPATHKLLRGGTSMAKVAANLEALRQHSPYIRLHFITTVTSLNIDAMEELVRFGLGLGVDRFVMREMFYFPDSNVVDHSRMPGLIVREGEFARMKERLLATFGSRARFEFGDATALDRMATRMATDSLRVASLPEHLRGAGEPSPACYVDLVNGSPGSNGVFRVKGGALTVVGWAVDSCSGTRVRLGGGVHVVLNDDVFPAAYGQRRDDVAASLGEAGIAGSGFEAVIPGGRVPRGSNTLGLLVTSHDGNARYKSTLSYTVLVE